MENVAEARNAAARRRLLSLMETQELDAVILRNPANLAWYSGGARSLIVEGPSVPIFDIVVSPSGDRLVTDEIEAERLLEEELPGLGLEAQILRWGEARDPILPDGPRVGSDTPMEGRVDVAGEIEAARRSLTQAEVESLPGARGRDLRGAHADHRGAEARGLGVGRSRDARRPGPRNPRTTGGAARGRRGAAAALRHPPPTSAAIGRRAMLVVCARRDGLIANVTRLVSFGPLDAEARDAYGRLLRVEAAFLDATRPGRRVGDVFTDGTKAYAVERLLTRTSGGAITRAARPGTGRATTWRLRRATPRSRRPRPSPGTRACPVSRSRTRFSPAPQRAILRC